MNTKTDTVRKMADSLIKVAELNGISLKGIPTDYHFNEFLDDRFKDSGEVRCERFCDIAWAYSLQFGPLDSPGFDEAQWACIEAALKQVASRCGVK